MEAVALWSHDRLQRIFEFAVPPVSLTWGGDFLAAATEAGEIAFLQADLEVPKAPAETAQSAPKEEGATTVPQDTEKPGEAKEELPTPVKPVTQAPVQLSFQPGATCGGSAGSGRRFLAWNEHGCLKLCPRRVQVDYFKCRDRSAPRELPSFEGLEFGALGPNFCALSSARKVLLHLATPLLSSRVCFEHELPFMERVEALAVGSFVAVFVSPQRLLRIFSTSFLPVAVLAMCGDCVAMVGSDERLFVVLQRCRGRRRENQLHFVLLDVEKGSRIAGGPLPLSPASTLRWIGFEGARPLALDSAGQVRALHGPGWVPVAQLSPHQWPVEADGKVLRCLEAKNGEVRVGAAKRLSSVALQAPFESFVPLAALDRDRAARKAALRVFEEQVKAKESELALDVARHFLAEVPAETLQAIAEKASLPELARRLGNKKQRLE
ncbi:unnamed protein product [Effrenium voratum]|nr:unnamed protein product [Effrenium voratum]